MITMSYGGGKQTVAMVTLVLEGKLPKPDLIVMADTGREVKTTWEYLDAVVRPALKQVGMTVEIAQHDLATVDLFSENGRKLLLPTFTRQCGSVGKMPTFCSVKWKQRVIRRWLRQQGVKQTDIWLGISLDEAERMKESDVKWTRNIYPLIEMTPMNRNGCIAQIQKFGWPVPHKSRCYMCPNQSPVAWKQMKQLGNGDFEKAVELEGEIQKKDANVFLHPLAIPLEKAVKLSEEQSDMFDGCDSGFCFT